MEILTTAAAVTTPIGLIGLALALWYLAYWRRLTSDERRLQSLPAEDRLQLADEYLTRYKIDASGVAPEDRVGLIRTEMAHRHKRSQTVMYLGAAVFVFCVAIVSLPFLRGARSESDSWINELDDRAALTLRQINRQIASLKELEKQGADVGSEIRTLSEAADRFPLLHKEYVSAVRSGDARLSHDRHSRISDLLSDPKLLAAIGTQFKPVYMMSAEQDENGNVRERKVVRWVPEPLPDGDDSIRSYLSAASERAGD